MVTNDDLISSIFKKLIILFYVSTRELLLLMLLLIILPISACNFIFMSVINDCIYIIIAVSHNSM